MGSLSGSSALHKCDSLSACSSGCCPADWRDYWRIESVRCGTNWQTLLEAAETPLRPAPPPRADLPKAHLESKNWEQIAADAWTSPGWKQAALEYHHARGNRTLIVETPPEDLARLRRLISDSVSLDAAWAELNDFRNRPTPKVTIEAVIHAVRERGLTALKEPVTAERLERCDAAAKTEIERRIAKLRKD